jgi:peptidoglycan/LPS O-acetylase OafA/YrhL
MIGVDVISFFSVDPMTGQLIFSGAANANAIIFIFIGQAWAVGIELIFYLISPFILKKRTSFLLGILIFSLILRIALYYFGFDNNPWRDRFFLTDIAFFMFGALAYKFYKQFKFSKNIKPFYYIFPVLVISIIIAYNYFPNQIIYYFSIKEWLFYGILTLSLPFMFIISNKMRDFDRFTSELSYPVFLSHVVIINFVAIFINFNLYDVSAKSWVILLTFAFSLLILKCVMIPIERIRQERVKIKK